MATTPKTDISKLVTVTVTYNPDLAVLKSQLHSLPVLGLKVIVDNASAAQVATDLEKLAADYQNVSLIRNDTNLGLAHALNQGVQAALIERPELEFVLLLDQDSEPHDNSVERLLQTFCVLEFAGHKVGGVGPTLRDPNTGLTHGFHRLVGWRWLRVYPGPDSEIAVPCTNLNGSGTLLRSSLLTQLHGLDETLFIDHVDTEWSFRVIDAGYSLWGVPNAIFEHRMGEAGVRFWLLGWRVWPARSPARHYYLFRNTVRLMRRPYVPRVWKVWAGIKLAMSFLIYALIDSKRKSQVRLMIRGVVAGWNKS